MWNQRCYLVGKYSNADLNRCRYKRKWFYIIGYVTNRVSNQNTIPVEMEVNGN